jgi:hypothetical protein
MGADISLQRLPNKGEIQDKTETTIFLMNRILDFILRNADIADMVSLATDDGCKKWIIIAESNLTKLFNKIKIKPEEGEKGILYLKQVSAIEKESKSEGLNKYYCEILSFFFIRLFQVVGALALSVLDTNLPLQDYSTDKKEVSYERKGVPFFKLEEEKKSFFSRIFSGGGLTDQYKITGKYEFLNNYLTFLNTNQYQLNTFSNARENKDRPLPIYVSKNDNGTYKFDFSDASSSITLTIELDDAKRNLILKNIELDNSDTSVKFTDTFTLSYSNGQALITTRSIDFANYILAKIEEIRSLPKSKVIIILKALNYLTSQGEFYKIKDTNIFLEKSKESDGNPWFLFTKESKLQKDKKIRFEFKILLKKEDEEYILKLDDIKVLTKDLYVDTSLEYKEVAFKTEKDPLGRLEPLYNKQTIPRYLENQMDILYKRAEESLEFGIKKGKEGYVRPLSDTKVKDNILKYTELWQRLSSDSPIKSFCVARALQLLNLSGLERVSRNSIKPFVYDAKFPLVVNKSLPSPGNPIVTTPSFRSLQTLYEVPSTNILKISNSYTSSRKISLDNLLRSFNSVGKKFEEVFEETGTTLPESEYTNRAEISKLRSVALKLFQTQFDHSKKVENLLKKIFIIDNTITLNPYILGKGIRGIEEIAVEARDLLTDYYSKCQTDYMAGVKILKRETPIRNYKSINK